VEFPPGEVTYSEFLTTAQRKIPGITIREGAVLLGYRGRDDRSKFNAAGTSQNGPSPCG